MNDPTPVDDYLAEVVVLYEERRAQWIADNPGAYPCEIKSAEAVIAWELGIA
jgi:hypothetical protein